MRASIVPESPHDISPLLIGAEVPPVHVKNAKGESIELRAAMLDTPTVLVFYRGGWCPVCSRHLREVSAVEPELAKLGYQVLAVSADKYEMLPEVKEERPLDITFLSDNTLVAAKAFGLAYKVDEITVEQYKKYGMDLEASSGQNHHMLPVPALFLVDMGAIIRFEYINPDYRVRIKSSLLVAAATAASHDMKESANKKKKN